MFSVWPTKIKMENLINSVSFAELILETLDQNLTEDKKCLLFGLGVNDPKGVFGTTIGLSTKFGESRVFETPTSENAMTGVGVGLAISGYKPIMVHQRLDFFLLAMDQLVNNAAKWHFMFGGGKSVPLTIRLILGRGWGQGPTHSQNLHSWFTHIPGLKVVMPAFAADVKALLNASISDPNPVIFIEDRWLHNQVTLREKVVRNIDLGVANVLKPGEDVTLISSGYMTILGVQACAFAERIGLNVEHIDLRTLKPLDENTIFNSIKKTGRVLVVDSGSEFNSYAAYVISRIVENCFEYLKTPPKILASYDVPEPTSHGVIGDFKINSSDILVSLCEITSRELPGNIIKEMHLPIYDIPDSTFTGPF